MDQLRFPVGSLLSAGFREALGQMRCLLKATPFECGF